MCVVTEGWVHATLEWSHLSAEILGPLLGALCVPYTPPPFSCDTCVEEILFLLFFFLPVDCPHAQHTMGWLTSTRYYNGRLAWPFLRLPQAFVLTHQHCQRSRGIVPTAHGYPHSWTGQLPCQLGHQCICWASRAAPASGLEWRRNLASLILEGEGDWGCQCQPWHTIRETNGYDEVAGQEQQEIKRTDDRAMIW